MTRDEAIAEIKRGIGYRSDKTDEIIAKLVMAQEEMERGKSLPWFLVSEDEDIEIAGGDPAVALPVNFIREVDDTGLDTFYHNDNIHLNKMDYSAALAKYQNVPFRDYPSAYAIRKNTIVFFPTPDVDMTLTWSYYAKAASLSAAAGNAWLDNFPYLLIGKAGKAIAANLRDVNAVSYFADMERTWMPIYFNELAAREEANTVTAVGQYL